MKLVAAQCPNCGANIEVDKNSDRTICDYCKTKIIVEEAIQKIELTGEVVIANSPKFQSIMQLAYEHYNMKEYNEAYIEYSKACELDPKNRLAKLRKGLCKSAMSIPPNLDITSTYNALLKAIVGETNQLSKNQFINEALSMLLFLDIKNDNYVKYENTVNAYFINALFIIQTYDNIMNFISDTQLWNMRRLEFLNLANKAYKGTSVIKYVNGYPTTSYIKTPKDNKKYLIDIGKKYGNNRFNN